MEGLISIPQFMAHLEQHGLVIVRKADLHDDAAFQLEKTRERLLKKPWLTLKEILDLQMLGITTKQGLRNWIENGTIRPKEHSVNTRNNIVVLTQAVLRLAGK